VSAGHSGSLASGQPGYNANVSVFPIHQAWTLRLCNAYAYEGWVHVFHSVGRRAGMSYTANGGDGETKLTKASGPLPFKRCEDISDVPLAVGSLIKFRIGGDMHIGTFFVDHLPMHGSMLQLVLRRRDTWSTAAAFSSHIFANTAGPQLALVDTYLGSAKSLLEVRDVPIGIDQFHESSTPEQEVHFGTIVDIAPGNYEWRLMAATQNLPQRHAEKASVEFKAVDKMAYTVLRVGAAAIGGQSFPEELIVMPADGVEVHRGTNSGSNNKGLFGIPKDLSKSSRRSSAMPHLLSKAALAIASALTITASIGM